MCRVCSERAQKHNEIMNKVPPKLCSSSKNNIYIYYGIDIESDDADIHPDKLCQYVLTK